LFGLLATLAEILSTFATRLLNGRGADQDVDVAACLLRIVVALQDLTIRGERVLCLAERLVAASADAGSDAGAETVTVTYADAGPGSGSRSQQAAPASEFGWLLDEQIRALDDLDQLLADSRPLLATVDVGFYPAVEPLLDGKSGLVTRWRQQVSQSRYSTTTLFFLPSDRVRSLVAAGREGEGPRSLEFVSAVSDRLHDVRRREIRDIRTPSAADDPAARARVAARVREEVAAARADLAHADAMCVRLHAAMERTLGREALAGLRRRLVPRPPR
jgi:hypothetical protein